jgi:hypothetical protein
MEACEAVVKILEAPLQMNERMLDSLLKLEQRQQDHRKALAQILIGWGLLSDNFNIFQQQT